jgi:aspartate-semialdehyde dehydrogenase
VLELCPGCFEGKNIDIALFAAGGSTSLEYAPQAAACGILVIDNSSAWRMDKDVPLVVPEVNPDEIDNVKKGIIANPNCSTIQAVVALKPLYDAFGINRIIYSTYQSVSGAGMKGFEDLKNGINGEKPKKFPYPIFGNLLPHIDDFLPDGYTKEEMKMVNETRKILGDDSLRITATTVRVPVFFSHSESINVELKKPFTVDEVREVFAKAKGVVLMDDPAKLIYPMPIIAEGKDEVFIGRIRKDYSIDNGLNIWVVADNIRKGAASNAVQIAEEYIKRHS